MLSITVDLKQNSVRMTGHANYAERGKDIVCSAASILFYTLCETLTGYEQGLKNKPRIRINDTVKDGIEAFCSCKPKAEYAHNIAIVLLTVCNGFRLLADGYPNNVALKIFE